MAKFPQPPPSIEPFPGGRLVRYLKDGYPHIHIQISGDQLAAALRGMTSADGPGTRGGETMSGATRTRSAQSRRLACAEMPTPSSNRRHR
jgi:hypothetical protein